MTITTYQEEHQGHQEYQAQIAEMILGIQQGEFNVPITLADQPDLLDIANFYQQNHGNFWVALNTQNKVIGSIALIDIGGNAGAIRKMFVRKEYRGKELGVAQKLLDTLLEWATAHEIHSLYLGTIERLQAAIRFYEKNEFTLLEKEDLPPTFPLMPVDTHFYERHLPIPLRR
jgi:putative acetyltransferase